MKHLKSFIDGIKNQSFCIKYRVTNHKAELIDGKENRISSYDSKIYDYIIKAESEESAKDKFENLWHSEVSGFHPMPDLNIIFVDKCEDSIDFDKVIHTY